MHTFITWLDILLQLLVNYVSACVAISLVYTIWLILFNDFDMISHQLGIKTTYCSNISIAGYLFTFPCLFLCCIFKVNYSSSTSLYFAGGKPVKNEGLLELLPVHVVTKASQLPIDFLEPSPQTKLVIGFDCEGVDLCRYGTLCIMQVNLVSSLLLTTFLDNRKENEVLNHRSIKIA